VIILGEFDLDFALFSGFYAFQTVLELWQHLPRSDFHRHVLAATAFENLAVDTPLEVHRYLIAGFGRVGDFLPGLALLAQLFEHILEIRVADLDQRLFDLDGL